MSAIRARKINDVVHSFCWVCRNRKDTFTCYPFLLIGVNRHIVATLEGYPKEYNLSWKWYSPFLNYFLASQAAKYPLALFQIFGQLQIFSFDWSKEEMQYAHSLMEKYYAQ